MKKNGQEHDLQELFEDLRRNDEASAPAFQEMWASKAAPRGSPKWSLALRPLAAVAVLALLLVTSISILRQRSTPVNYTLDQWNAPTDFLLRTPGSEILRAFPAIPAALPDPSHTSKHGKE